MSDSKDDTKMVTRCSLPKFKDKVMYVKSSNDVEQSYTISSSFKGILRLSPNDVNSVNETKEIINLPEELYELDTNYSDAIVFENSASIKSNASIERRMIIASDSDSYAVDLRISDVGVEFDNLNVVGISKFNHLTLFCKDTKENKQSFKLGNSDMMTCYNDRAYKLKGGINYDVKKINVTKDGGDESYILSGEEKDGRRNFRYFRTKNFIEELVMEALLDLQTIPTGSIHFVPITMEQYKKLTANGNKKPNRYTPDTDPIVRDFLLCDGRLYNSKDFPELAKMLWNEKVYYWNDVSYEGKTLVHKFEHKNKFSENINPAEEPVNPEKYFRVPDLRRMFISSILASGIDGYMEDASAIDEDYNVAGYWLPDNVPTSLDGDFDNHFHFIAYGSYTPIVSYPTGEDFTFVKGQAGQFESVADEDYETKVVRGTGAPAILTLTNHLSWSRSVKEGPGFGTGTGGLRRRDYWGYEPLPGIAYMAGPRTGRNNVRDYIYAAPSTARTSYCFLNSPEVFDNRMAYGADANDVLHEEKYQPFDPELYGHENTPKYVACLPLIKI